MQRKNFIRTIENFTCDYCGTQVIGNGYTDHCPECLYSKHVDEGIPGDRLSRCQGLLEPVGLRTKEGKQQIEYRCLKCGKLSYCKTTTHDNPDALLRVSQGLPSLP